MAERRASPDKTPRIIVAEGSGANAIQLVRENTST
jgi:hypothetical protein